MLCKVDLGDVYGLELDRCFDFKDGCRFLSLSCIMSRESTVSSKAHFVLD